MADDGGWAGDTSDLVRRLVSGHRPGDAGEREACRVILAELGRLAAPCDEHADPVHVTASALMVGTRGTILHRHRRLGIWLQPGGHIDEGETPWQAAVREAHEETGLVVRHPPGGPRLTHVDVHPGPLGHTHFDLRYVVLAGDGDPAPPPGESPEVRWCTWEEAAVLADDALAGALVAARRQWESGLVRA